MYVKQIREAYYFHVNISNMAINLVFLKHSQIIPQSISVLISLVISRHNVPLSDMGSV